jgi:hypothetical protein
VGGAIFQALGSRAPFLLGGALLAVLFLIALRAIRPEAEGSPPPILAPAAVSH